MGSNQCVPMASLYSSIDSPYLIHGIPDGFIEMHDVDLVSSRGFVLDASGLIVNETVDEHIYWLPKAMHVRWMRDRRFDSKIIEERIAFIQYHATELRNMAMKSKSVRVLDSSYHYVDLTHPFGWYAFGHLHDSLQRLFNIRDWLQGKSDTVRFILSRYSRVNDFIEHMSALVGFKVKSEHMLELREFETLKCPRLVKPGMPSVYTNFRSDVADWMFDAYGGYFGVTEGPRTRLYLSRNHVKPGKRGVLNEDELLPLLRNNGYEVLTGNENLSQIYEKFSKASHIIGPHGSLFANSIFAPEDCEIIEFCPHNRVDGSFLRKNKKAKNYKQILVDADENFNISIRAYALGF